MARAARFWIFSRSNLWFVPALIVLGATLLAWGLVKADERYDSLLQAIRPRLLGVGADGAMAMLGAIASSVITVAGTIFALTIVALTLASTQFTPRVMRNFMRSLTTQVALGVFVGIFAYSLIVLRTIRTGEHPFVPYLSVLMAVILAFVGIGFLVFFIHYIFSSIQVSMILSEALRETYEVIDVQLPFRLGRHEADTVIEADVEERLKVRHWQDVPALRAGYIQLADQDELFDLACRLGTTIRMTHGSGAFICECETLAKISLDTPPDARLVRKINDCYVIGAYRIINQDIAFGIWQMVDIALKALSAAVNDTSTGVACVNYLTAVVTRVVQRRSVSPYQLQDGQVRLVRVVPTFAKLLDQTFDQIRHNAQDNIAVIIRLMVSLNIIAGMTDNADRLRELQRHLRLVVEMAERTLRAPDEREMVRTQLSRLENLPEAKNLLRALPANHT